MMNKTQQWLRGILKLSNSTRNRFSTYCRQTIAYNIRVFGFFRERLCRMMLHFVDTDKLKTKKIIFEDVFLAQDAYTLEQLRDLSSKRKAVEDILNRSSSGNSSSAKRVSGLSTRQTEVDIENLKCYVALLNELIAQHDANKEHPQMVKWVSDLKIRWTSSMHSSNFLTQIGGSPKFYQLNDLRFERFMVQFFYGTTLRRLGLEIKSTDLVQSATFLRKAAGVFDYLACEASTSFEKADRVDRPLELSRPSLTAMSLISLAEAQAVAAQRAEEKETSVGLLAKLHLGIAQMMNEALQALCIVGQKDISQRLMDYIWFNKVLHEFSSQKYLAEQFKAEGKFGISIGILRAASTNLIKELPSNESWRGTFTQQIASSSELLKKLERENDFVWRDKVCTGYDLPIVPEGKKIVQSVQFEFEPKPQLKKQQLMFNLEGGNLVKGKPFH